MTEEQKPDTIEAVANALFSTGIDGRMLFNPQTAALFAEVAIAVRVDIGEGRDITFEDLQQYRKGHPRD